MTRVLLNYRTYPIGPFVCIHVRVSILSCARVHVRYVIIGLFCLDNCQLFGLRVSSF